MSFFSFSGWVMLIPEVFSALLASESRKDSKKMKGARKQRLVYANSDSRIFKREPVPVTSS